MMVPVGRLVLLRTVPKSELVQVLSYLTIPALVGPMVGPPLGGFITTYFDWRWIFLINLPMGLVGIVPGRRFVPWTISALVLGLAFGLLAEWTGNLDVRGAELIVARCFSRTDTRNWDLSTFRCAFEAWPERASITPSAHPAFRQSVGASDGIVFNVDTVRRSIRQFPDGERVLVEERSNSYSSPVTYRR